MLGYFAVVLAQFSCLWASTRYCCSGYNTIASGLCWAMIFGCFVVRKTVNYRHHFQNFYFNKVATQRPNISPNT